MNYLDVIIGLILLLFAYKGLKKGLIVEAFSLAAFLIGIYGAMYLSDITAKGLAKIIDAPQEIMTIIAFIITFIILAILVTFIGKLISKIVEALFLGFIDKIGGFVFGIVKGALLISILILVLNFFGLTDIVDNKILKACARGGSLRSKAHRHGLSADWAWICSLRPMRRDHHGS